MTLRTTTVLSFLLMLACTGVKIDDTSDTSDTADSGDTASGGEAELDPELAYTAAQLPMAYAFVVGFMAAGDATDCPSVVATSETVTTLSGDCTDSEGTAWTGTAVLTETGDSAGSIAMTDFGNSEVTVTGSIEIGAALTSDLVVDLDYEGQQLTLTYADYGVDDWQGYGNGLFNGEGSSNFSGLMTYAQDGASVVLTASGSMSNAGTCSDEFDAGTLTLSGHSAGDLVYTWDGAGCDGCADWSFDGATGTACE